MIPRFDGWRRRDTHGINCLLPQLQDFQAKTGEGSEAESVLQAKKDIPIDGNQEMMMRKRGKDSDAPRAKFIAIQSTACESISRVLPAGTWFPSSPDPLLPYNRDQANRLSRYMIQLQNTNTQGIFLSAAEAEAPKKCLHYHGGFIWEENDKTLKNQD